MIGSKVVLLPTRVIGVLIYASASIQNRKGRYGACGQASVSALLVRSGDLPVRNAPSPVLICSMIHITTPFL